MFARCRSFFTLYGHVEIVFPPVNGGVDLCGCDLLFPPSRAIDERGKDREEQREKWDDEFARVETLRLYPSRNH